MPDDLDSAILDILQRAAGPLKAREIAEQCKRRGLAGFSGTSKENTSRVNSCLYRSGLSRLVRQDADYRWSLGGGAADAPGPRPTPAPGPPKQRASDPPRPTPPSSPNPPKKADAEPDRDWITIPAPARTPPEAGFDAAQPAVDELFDDARPGSWIGCRLSGIYRLVYEAGGPRAVDVTSGPLSLPPDIAGAWAVWAGVDDDPADGRWEEARVDELGDERGYAPGEYWRRWVPRPRRRISPDGENEAPLADGALGDTSHRSIFKQYVLRHRALADGHGDDHDPAYAERVFLRAVAIRLMEEAVLERLNYQVPFRDGEGGQRYCDFVLTGAKTYAIEIEGHGFHAAQNVSQERFAEERRRVQAFARIGWVHFPIAFLDLVNGVALRSMAALLRDDPVLAPLLVGGVDQLEPDLPPIKEQVLEVFPALQGILLALYSGRGSDQPVHLAQRGLDFPLLELAVRDLDVLGSHICHLHGEQWTRPAVAISVNGPRELLERARHAFGVEGEGSTLVDHRLDRPLTQPAPTDVQVEEGSGGAGETALLQLSALTGPAWLPLSDLLTFPPLPPPSGSIRARRPLVERATPRVLDAVARRLFGVPWLRPEQLTVIRRSLGGEALLAVLPTGFGKSLCFQLPAYLSIGTTFVVSPLKSLMRDQVRGLRQRGLGAGEHISSDLDPSEKALVLARLRRGRLKMLYLSPERLEIKSFALPLLASLGAAPISLLAVDEAHCVSEWGHDFRPAYLRVRQMAELMRGSAEPVPVLGLTATASAPVRTDVCRILQITPDCVIQSRSIDRPELSLSVHPVEDGRPKADEVFELASSELPHLLDVDDDAFVTTGADQGSILVFGIYAAATGKTTRDEGIAHIADRLLALGVEDDAMNLHSSRKPPVCAECGSVNILGKYREGRYSTFCEDCDAAYRPGPDGGREWTRTLLGVQDAYLDNQFPILVATKGFGMGIDKPDIRAVIHHCMAGGLEAFYQEGGRAGRDQRHAHVALVYRPPSDSCVDEYFDSFGSRSADGGEGLVPPCLSDAQARKFRRCPRGLEGWCDYARQADFVLTSFPEPEAEVERAGDIYEALVRAAEPRHVDARNQGRNADAVQIQLALHRLDLLGLVDTYWVSYPRALRIKRFEVTLPRSWTLGDACDRLETYLAMFGDEQVTATRETLAELRTWLPEGSAADGSLGLPPRDWVEASVALQLEASYRVIRSMRMRMLHNLWRYAEETMREGRCRRWLLTSELDAQEFARPEDHRCEFCDVCRPERPLSFGDRPRAAVPTGEWRNEDLAQELEQSLEAGDLRGLDQIVEMPDLERGLLSLRNRALHHLEARPESLGAHYLAARAAQKAARRGQADAGRLRTQASAHASNAYHRRETTGGGADDLEPFVRVLEEVDPEHAVEVMDRQHGPYDSAQGVARLARVAPRLPANSAARNQVRGAVAAVSARSAARSLEGINALLAGIAIPDQLGKRPRSGGAP